MILALRKKLHVSSEHVDSPQRNCTDQSNRKTALRWLPRWNLITSQPAQETLDVFGWWRHILAWPRQQHQASHFIARQAAA
jgi:hypothetical protein